MNTSEVRIKYLSAEEFAMQMVMALKSNQMEQFKQNFRNDLDVLLIEDIHFLQGKSNIQGEFLGTLKALNDRGRIIVFTSSFLPKELSGVDNQLCSRLCEGFMATIGFPDFETRRRIIEQKASAVYQAPISLEVSSMLAEHLQNDIRQLESCLKNLVLKARLLGQEITTDLAWQALQNYETPTSGPGIDHIMEAVCHTFRLSKEDLSSKSRKRNIVIARNTAFYLARKHTPLSLKEIGQRFNRRHSTVLKGITNLEREIATRTPLGRQVEQTLEHINL
jgi:chromosomal replication initiator protein